MNAMKHGTQVAFRCEQASLDLADELVALIGRATPVPTTRAAVLRAALERGLADMKAELTSTAGKRKR